MVGLAGKCRLEPGSGSSGFQPERGVFKLNLPCNCLPEWTEPLWSPSIVGRAVAARPPVDKTEPKNKRNKTQIQNSQLKPSYRIKTCPIGGWPNDTPNSSQVTTIETFIGGWTNGTAKSSHSLQENRSIVRLRPRNHLTITKQLGSSWFELAKRSLGELDQIQASSSQVGGQTIPNSIQFTS